MTKTKSPKAEAEKPAKEPKKIAELPEVALGMANLLHNLHGLDVPAQLKRQELLADFRALNPEWEAVRVHH